MKIKWMNEREKKKTNHTNQNLVRKKSKPNRKKNKIQESETIQFVFRLFFRFILLFSIIINIIIVVLILVTNRGKKN